MHIIHKQVISCILDCIQHSDATSNENERESLVKFLLELLIQMCEKGDRDALKRLLEISRMTSVDKYGRQACFMGMHRIALKYVLFVFMCIHVWRCALSHVYVCLCVCMYVCFHAYLLCMHTYIHARMHTCMEVCIESCVCVWSVFSYMYVCVYVCVYVCLCVCMYVCFHTCMYVRMHA
jgi:hypothetical protein